jgi:hypothetical protein
VKRGESIYRRRSSLATNRAMECRVSYEHRLVAHPDNFAILVPSQLVLDVLANMQRASSLQQNQRRPAPSSPFADASAQSTRAELTIVCLCGAVWVIRAGIATTGVLRGGRPSTASRCQACRSVPEDASF